MLFSTSLSLWLHDLLIFWDVTDHGKSQQSNIANKWKSAFKILYILQKGILKWNTKEIDIFLNALYIMLCCVKEVKISEVFQSANQLPFVFYIFFYISIGVGKKTCSSRNKSWILNTALLYPFVSWSTFIKMWKLTWYWEVTDSSLKEIIIVYQMRHNCFTHWFFPGLGQI